MLPMVRAAERGGHEVRIATGADLVGPLRDRGLAVSTVGPSWAESWAAHTAVWAESTTPAEQRLVDGAIALFGTPAASRLTDLTAMAEDWRPDLVVHEVTELAGSTLARRLGVPGVVHGIGPMFPFYATLLGAIGVAAGDSELWDHLTTETYLNLCPAALQPDGPAPWPHARPLRPSAGEPGTVAPEVAALLASDRPLAYFTLGTVKNQDTSDLVAGLVAMRDYDGDVVVTTGRAVDRQELGELPDNVVLAEYLPQAELLPHLDLVVSHSGSGTMLGGLCHGVPQVALPRGTDQPDNAALLARSGAGVVVAPEDYGVESIRAAVATVCSDPSYAHAARRVQREIAAMPDADDVLARLLDDTRIRR
jgi:UDP-glucoronosyl and UDP-glucosyl transferase